MQCEVWIASHFGRGDPTRHRTVLLETLKSLAPYPEITHVRIGLSYDFFENSPSNQEMIQILKEKRLTVYRYLGVRKQFDHLRHIFSQFDGDINTLIMFMDDDDILLHMPLIEPTYLGSLRISGRQYLPRNYACETDIISTDSWKNIIETKPILFEIVSDFSGYTCSINDLTTYFLKHPPSIQSDDLNLQEIQRRLAALEDTQFMNYIDSLSHVTPIPFIYHRIWRQLNEKDWVH